MIGFSSADAMPNKIAKLPVEESVVFTIEGQIDAHFSQWSDQKWANNLDWDKLRNIYESHHFAPIWLDKYGIASDKAKLLRDTVIDAFEDGLDPDEYHSRAIRYMWNARRVITMARLDLLITDAFLRYVREVKAGYFSPRSVDFDWKVPGRRVDLLDELAKYLATDNPEQYLADLIPQHKEYLALKTALAKYRKIASQGGWKKIDAGPTLNPGDQDVRVDTLRFRLVAEGYLPKSNLLQGISNVFDNTLEEAVLHFQKTNGLEPDGLVGGATLRRLNISVGDRITTIKKNMERWRWMPDNLGKRYVMVNTAAYELKLVEDSKPVLDMPVVVGETDSATPTFIDNLEYLEVNPVWNVPPKIARDTFLPKLLEDPNFIKTNRLKIYDGWKKTAKEVDPDTIHWDKYANHRWLPFKFEQEPGKLNSLGLIKFIFPNRYRIYLHGTPEKELFNYTVRTFSHGCVRLSDPYSLAKKLLESEDDWNKDQFQSIVASGKTQRFNLKTKWPVYLMYWTAWVDDNGFVNFRKDVYQRNRLIAAGSEPDYQKVILAQNIF